MNAHAMTIKKIIKHLLFNLFLIDQFWIWVCDLLWSGSRPVRLKAQRCGKQESIFTLMFLVYTHWSCDMYGRTEISRAAKPILKHFYKQGAFSQEAQLYEYETIF